MTMATSRVSAEKIPGGLTLVEVIFSSIIMSLVVLLVYLVLHRSTETAGNESLHLSLDERAREVLAEIARDLRESARHTLSSGDPPAPVPLGQAVADLRFGVNSGYDMTQRKLLFTRIVRYRFVLGPGEIPNGTDDDGDGLVDEGAVEKTDRFGVTTRICSDVAASGLKFVVSDRLVTVTLVLERRDAKRTLLRREAVTSVELRN